MSATAHLRPASHATGRHRTLDVVRASTYAGPAALLAASAATLLVPSALADASGASGPAGGMAAPWTVVAAVAALVLGVPHGAVDHLTLSAPLRGGRRAAAAAAYLALAAAGTAAVLLAPAPAFLAVVALSVWHFGTGDVESLRDTGAAMPAPRTDRLLHVLALGAVPVLLPLTSASGAAALASLEPSLAGLAVHPAVPAVRACVLLVAVLCVGRLVAARSWRAAGELVVLVAACLVLPAFLAFALYFSAWHATRHTVRLALADDGQVDRARLRTVLRDGLPSLLVAVGLVTAAAVVGLPATTTLWAGLAVVWGLTVPHTAAVTALDARRRRARVRHVQAPGGGSDTIPDTACTSVSWRNVNQS